MHTADEINLDSIFCGLFCYVRTKLVNKRVFHVLIFGARKPGASG
jgi:hypothetical protein